MTNCTCSACPDSYPGKAMDDLPQLRGHLMEVGTDPKLWTTQYRCSVCGQRWDEIYEGHGQSNVPSVRKSRP